MMRFYGYELELFDSEVLQEHHGVSVRTGIDRRGDQWLIVRVDDNPDHLVWVCAPISPRALHEVAAGKAAIRDVLRHSCTGTVEVVTVDHGRAVPDSCLLCAAIPGALLPTDNVRVALAA